MPGTATSIGESIKAGGSTRTAPQDGADDVVNVTCEADTGSDELCGATRAVEVRGARGGSACGRWELPVGAAEHDSPISSATTGRHLHRDTRPE